MKVLVCIPCLLTGGTEIQTLSLVQALVKAGHQVAVACYFEHTPGMVDRYRKAGAGVLLMSPDGTRCEGSKAVAKHLWRGLKRAVRDFRPDVAHVQYMAPGAIPIAILRLLGVRKVVATSHTGADIYPSLRVPLFVARRLCNVFQCITERAERSFFGSSSIFGGDTKLRRRGNHFTIYNTLPSYITLDTQPRLHGDNLTVGVVSRLEHIKGMDLVVPAFAKAYAENPDLRLLVVGQGSQRPLMERQALDACLPDYAVQFAGVQPQDRLQGFYDNIDILLMPSRSEGFGLTAIEGMARGCVPVVSDTGGLPEVVTSGTGLLHRPGDADDMASCILRLASDRDALYNMSRAALERARVFSAERYNRCIATLYDKL